MEKLLAPSRPPIFGRTTKAFRNWSGSLLLAILASPATLPAQNARSLSPDLQKYVRVGADRVVLRGAALIDGTGAPAAEGRVILIDKGRIAAVGNASDVKVPADAEVLELGGHTIIPGLVGMHDHLYATGYTPLEQARMYLANGVTTIRTAGTFQPYNDLNLKRDIDAGQWIGPRIHASGPYLTGPGGSQAMVRLSSPDAARRVVAYWAEEGATWIKVYDLIRRRELGAVIKEAHRRGLKVTGHLCSITYREAVALGIDNIEHGLVAATDFDPEKTLDTCPAGSVTRVMQLATDVEQFQPLIRLLVDHGVALTSTLPVIESFVPGRPAADERVLSVMSAESREAYRRAREQLNAGAMPQQDTFFKKEMTLERAFVEAGGLLVAGIDPVVRGVLPGFADQRNYELLVEAGFAPSQAVQIMTSNGARLLGERDKLGTIEVGKLADLVVLNGNLVSDRTAIRRLAIVFKAGVGFDAVKLVASLAAAVVPSATTEVKLPPEILRRYVGEYEFDAGAGRLRGRVLMITLEGDRLTSQVTGQQKAELFAENETRFFMSVARILYVFDVAQDRSVKGVTVFQGGAEAYLKKIK